jgi:cytochrome P450
VLSTSPANALARVSLLLLLLLLQVEAMPYTDAVISESMRLHLTAALLGSSAHKDVVVGGVTVPKGTTVFSCQSRTAINEQYFSYATRFWPEVSKRKLCYTQETLARTLALLSMCDC